MEYRDLFQDHGNLKSKHVKDFACPYVIMSFGCPKKWMSKSASEDMDFLAAGIEAIDPARSGPVAASLRDGEKIALLPTVPWGVAEL